MVRHSFVLIPWGIANLMLPPHCVCLGSNFNPQRVFPHQCRTPNNPNKASHELPLTPISTVNHHVRLLPIILSPRLRRRPPRSPSRPPPSFSLPLPIQISLSALLPPPLPRSRLLRLLVVLGYSQRQSPFNLRSSPFQQRRNVQFNCQSNG